MKNIIGILLLAVLLTFSAGCINTDSIGDLIGGDASSLDTESLTALTSLLSQGEESSALLEMLMSGDAYASGYPSEEELHHLLQMSGGFE